MRRPGRLVLLAVLLLFAAVMLVPALASFLTDWWWFQNIGYGRMFGIEQVTRGALLGGTGLLAFAVLYGNLRLAQRGLSPHLVLVQSRAADAPRFDVALALRRLSLPLAVVLALAFALPPVAAWKDVLLFLAGGRFGTADPVFGRDIGFYLFRLPLLDGALAWLFALLLITLLLTVPLYWLRGDLVLRRARSVIEPSAARHLTVLLGSLFVLQAVQLWLVRAPELLYASTGPLAGAAYTDLHATLPALRIMAIVALAGAALVVAGEIRNRLLAAAGVALGGYIVLSVLLLGLLPAAVQKFVVGPTELTREEPQIRWHIDATRKAWGLDRVVSRELSGEARLSLKDIRANAATVENVRLWDRDPLLQTFGQLQEIRTYYDFVHVDDDRYTIEGRYRQVLLSPRELNVSSLPVQSFINEHLTFTHGMGLTMSPVNQVTDEGLPVLFVKNLPPVSTVSLPVTRPGIYYGELTDSYVLTPTRQPEFDYPAGDTNVFHPYEGRGGMAVGGVLRRSLYALRFGSLKLLLSQDVGDSTRILFRRSIRGRAEAALPFLDFDNDPYLVLRDDGTLAWILDGYIRSAWYPYSEPLRDGTRYMRNSVKVIIDAYDGSVQAYLAAPDDPVIQAWASLLPGLLQPLSAMPADLRAHLRYPEDIYRLQSALYATYHMDQPDAFYHREDQWQIPTVEQREQAGPFMRHIIMRLPEEQQAEFIFMTPFTPRGKDNLAAWMVARNDGANYGQLMVYRFPRQSLVYGPQQIETRINQDTEISRQVSLWDQRGSEVIWGDLLVIPIEESLIYVQPLYLRAQGGKIPELKRVVVAYQNRVVMDATLDQALSRLFGAEPETAQPAEAAAPPPEAAQAGTQAGLLRQARSHYERALAAQRAGEWARYGDEIDQLGRVLKALTDSLP